MITTSPETLQAWLDWALQAFETHHLYFGHGTDNATDEALYIFHYALKDKFESLCENPDTQLSAQQNHSIKSLLDLRISTRKPVAYLVNEAWFAGYPFYVDERVLVPRSPLAELIEQQFSPWLEVDRIRRVLDIGTGSGCIAIACAHYLPQASVDAVDLMADALDVARLNVSRHHLESRVQLYQADIYTGLPQAKYDLIVSNPPYVDQHDMQSLPEEYRHEPQTGLAAGEDGLDCVRKILHGAADYLNPDGVLIVEVGNSQQAVESAWPQVPFMWLEFEYGGAGVFLLEARQVLDFHAQFA